MNGNGWGEIRGRGAETARRWNESKKGEEEGFHLLIETMGRKYMFHTSKLRKHS